MQHNTHAEHDKQNAYPPLDQVTRSHVNTDAASFYLLRRPQTLRMWACFESGPTRPIRINGKLAWKVADIRAILNWGK